MSVVILPSFTQTQNGRQKIRKKSEIFQVLQCVSISRFFPTLQKRKEFFMFLWHASSPFSYFHSLKTKKRSPYSTAFPKKTRNQLHALSSVVMLVFQLKVCVFGLTVCKNQQLIVFLLYILALCSSLKHAQFSTKKISQMTKNDVKMRGKAQFSIFSVLENCFFLSQFFFILKVA